MPTEIFRPGAHPGPGWRAPVQMAPRSGSATRVAPPPRAAPAARAEGPRPGAMAPVSVADLSGDDWDGETVVKQQANLMPARRPEAKPFVSPEQTVNLKGEIDIDVDFGDETQHQPPRRTR